MLTIFRFILSIISIYIRRVFYYVKQSVLKIEIEQLKKELKNEKSKSDSDVDEFSKLYHEYKISKGRNDDDKL